MGEEDQKAHTSPLKTNVTECNISVLTTVNNTVVGNATVPLVVKNPPATAADIRDLGLIPGSGRPPGGGQGNPLQCSCLEKLMDRGAQWATARRVSRVGHD